PGPGPPARAWPPGRSVPRALLRKTELLDNQGPWLALLGTDQLVDKDKASLPLVGGRADGALVEEEEGTVEEEVEAPDRHPQCRQEQGDSPGFRLHQLLPPTGSERDRLRPEPLVGDLALVAVDDEGQTGPGQRGAASDHGGAEPGYRGAVRLGPDLIGEE